MKNFCFIAILAGTVWSAPAQNIAINTSGAAPDPSAILDISSSDKGILIPRMTSGDRESISGPAEGLLVYDTDTRSLWHYSDGWHKHTSFALPYEGSTVHGGHALSVHNTFNGFVATTAIHGQRQAASGIALTTSSAIWGDAAIGTGILGTSDYHPGVYGQSLQSNGIEGYAVAATKAGVFGYSAAQQGVGIRGSSALGAGVEGIAQASNYPGVQGKTTAPSGGVGVRGQSLATDDAGIGVYGLSSASSPDHGGVVGYNSKSGGIGVNGRSPFGIGVNGFAQSHLYPAVRGFHDNAGTGVYGFTWEFGAPSLHPKGVHGRANTYEAYGYGVYGSNDGYGDGVYGIGGWDGYGVAGYGREGGGGGAGYFEVTTPASTSTVVKIVNQGMSESLMIDANNSGNAASALILQNSGTGNLAVFQNGAGTNLIRMDNTGKGFFNGGTQMGGADVAEMFETEEPADVHEPGDVLVISTSADRKVTKSSSPYSTLVAGVYATRPGVILTEEEMDADLSGHVPMGVIGVIPTKVCLEGGEIRRGDLLVTSSQAGVAMKGNPDLIRPGQVIGKALETYNGVAPGLIKVLVTVR